MKTFILFLAVLFCYSSISAQVSVEYMVHIQSDGWSQGWVAEGQIGGKAKKVDRIMGNTEEGNEIVQEFMEATDDRKRMEGIKIRLKNAPDNAYIEYSAHS